MRLNLQIAYFPTEVQPNLSDGLHFQDSRLCKQRTGIALPQDNTILDLGGIISSVQIESKLNSGLWCLISHQQMMEPKQHNGNQIDQMDN
jgi:hypothetical protein